MIHPSPTFVSAVVVDIAAVVLEGLATRRRGRRVPGTAAHEPSNAAEPDASHEIPRFDARDALASCGTAVVSLAPLAVINAAMLALASLLWSARLFDLGTHWLAWCVAILGWDFLFYWEHRWEHRVRFLWAGHVTHHSSRRFNYTTAIRQSGTAWLAAVLYPMLALVGVRIPLILVAGVVSRSYQFFLHTEFVSSLPEWWGVCLNTPSFHRVHHASNHQYLDKNLAGMFMWDRCFGTFEPEREPVQYGIVHNVDTYNPLRLAFHEYVDIAHDVRSARGWRTRIGYVLRPPLWMPAVLAPPAPAR
ncbi:MAG: sterol desaturase family protein [Acidimicrobiia bacterium]